MVHTFSTTDSLDLSSVEGYIINQICENENDKITNITLPVKGSEVYNYSKLLSIINKLQDKNNTLSDDEIEENYKTGKNILSTYGRNINNLKYIKTISEELDLLYMSLKKSKNEKWESFKNSKINQLNLKFNHTKINETKILTEKKYSSKLESKIGLEELLEKNLNLCKNDNIKNFNKYFNYEAYAWLFSNADINVKDINYRFPNVFKSSINDNSERLLISIIEEYNKNSNSISDKFEKLTLEQMKKLNKIDKKICNSPNYINNYLKKILPNDPKKLKIDSEEFKQLEDFANIISNSNYQNDLKYLILHLKLKNAIVEGLPYNKNDFISYLKIPYCSLMRSSLKSSFRDRKKSRDNMETLQLSSSYIEEIEDDDTIIKFYLTYFFQKDSKLDVTSWKQYTDYLNEYDLKKIFVEARLTKYPNELQTLQKDFEYIVDNSLIDRVELNFEKFTNPIKYNNKKEETTFRLSMKNINTLYVREYEINTLAVCKECDENIDSFYLNFSVSGLLPINETTYSYNKNPLE
eukprot:jgi/Orpsp1_1/1177008/evm.model.c7180000059806.1